EAGSHDAGVLAAVGLVNGLTPGWDRGRLMPTVEPLSSILRVLAVDPPSVATLTETDAPEFVAIAHRLRDAFVALDSGDVDTAAHLLTALLAAHPANPHLAKEHGHWRLHHHPVDAALVPMWTSICAEGLARMIGAGQGDRLGVCEAPDCH